MDRPQFPVLFRLLLFATVLPAVPALGQLSELDQIQVAPPMRQVQAPSRVGGAGDIGQFDAGAPAMTA